MGSLGRRTFAVVVGSCALLVCAALAPGAFATTGQPPTITLQATRPHVRGGKSDELVGSVTNAPSGSQVKLVSRPFPYAAGKVIGVLTPSASGNFSIHVSPLLDTHYVAVLTGTAARADAAVGVFYQSKITVRAVSLGRARFMIVMHHPAGFHWSGARVRWYFEPSGHHHFDEAHS